MKPERKMEIKTERLTLRPVQPGDEMEIHEYAGDQNITMMFYPGKTSGEYTCMITKSDWEKNRLR